MSQRKMAFLGLLAIAILFGSMVGMIQAQEFGTNWSATFFPTNNLSGTGTNVGGINGLNFNWGTGVPIVNGVAVPGMPADNFSARFNSTQTFQAATYTFTVSSDDGVRVFIDGQNVLDRFVGRALTTDTFQKEMTAGSHNLTVEYFEGIDNAILQVQWGATGAVSTAGPSPTPGPTATPAPTGLPSIPGGSISATVIRATVLVIRSGPSAYSDRLGTVRRGQTYQVVGRDENARWFLLQLSGFQGWALGYYLYINTNEFNAPVVSSFALGGNPAALTGNVAVSYTTLKLRSQPNIYSDQIGRITWGGTMAITGKTRSGEWWRVVWKGTEGWAWSAFLRVAEGSIDSVPIVP
ncbi:MAG: SH3 domain-containing protein [Chloroflexota bacterium]